MKKYLLLLLLLPFFVQAQKSKSPMDSLKKYLNMGIKVDSITKKIIYEGVEKVEGATKDELYVRAREWFARTFNSANKVLQMDDKAAGKLIGKASEPGVSLSLFTGGFMMDYTVSITVKEGRYRYEITNYILTDFPSTYNLNPKPIPAEIYLLPAYKDSKGNFRMFALGYMANVSINGPTLYASIKQALAQPASGVKTKDDF